MLLTQVVSSVSVKAYVACALGDVKISTGLRLSGRFV